MRRATRGLQQPLHRQRLVPPQAGDGAAESCRLHLVRARNHHRGLHRVASQVSTETSSRFLSLGGGGESDKHRVIAIAVIIRLLVVVGLVTLLSYFCLVLCSLTFANGRRHHRVVVGQITFAH